MKMQCYYKNSKKTTNINTIAWPHNFDAYKKPHNFKLLLSRALSFGTNSQWTLDDLVTSTSLHFGMLYHTIFALILILLNLILFSRYLLLNSTSSWKLTFFFIPILLSLASLYWTDPLELWSGLSVIRSLFILYPSSSIRSSAQLVLILCLSYSVSE